MYETLKQNRCWPHHAKNLTSPLSCMKVFQTSNRCGAVRSLRPSFVVSVSARVSCRCQLSWFRNDLKIDSLLRVERRGFVPANTHVSSHSCSRGLRKKLNENATVGENSPTQAGQSEPGEDVHGGLLQTVLETDKFGRGWRERDGYEEDGGRNSQL